MRIAALALLLGSIGCRVSSKVSAPPPSGLAAAVTGTWTLTSGCGGIVYLCRTPDALPVPIRIAFHADGTADLYKNGQSTATRGTYSLVPSAADSLRAGMLTLTPGLEGATDTLSLAFSIEGNLILSEPCCDRLAYTFRKQFAPD